MRELADWPAWLPPFVEFNDYDRNWDCYFEALYQFFKRDFVDSSPSFRGIRLGLKRHPFIDGKEATFWHLISEGPEELKRNPDFQRCKRIRWPRPVIENVDGSIIKIWENKRRRGETRTCLWFESQEYLVVLALRKDYLLPWTAYMVKEPHRQRKLQREYEAAHRKANAAS